MSARGLPPSSSVPTPLSFYLLLGFKWLLSPSIYDLNPSCDTIWETCTLFYLQHNKDHKQQSQNYQKKSALKRGTDNPIAYGMAPTDMAADRGSRHIGVPGQQEDWWSRENLMTEQCPPCPSPGN